MKVRVRGVALAAVSLVTLAAAAHAQDAAPQPASPPTTAPAADAGASDIIVTARRREENIEKVPIAIAAIGRQQLAQRSIFSENDLQASVPGLTIRQQGSANQFNYSIRGQTVDNFSNSPPGVLPYIDEAQIITHNASTFYDLDGIQVLKGPQGTLFGRNATGGAVLYQTGRVADQFGGYLDGRYGNFDSRHLEGAINLPFADGSGFRLSGSYTGGGAYIYNVPTNQYLGDLDQKSLRGTLKLKPFEGFVNTTVMQYTHDRGTNTPIEAFSAYTCGTPGLVSSASCVFNPATPAFAAYIASHPGLANYGAGLDAIFALQKQLGPWKSLINAPTDHRASGFFAINTTTFDVAPGVTLKNIASFNSSKSNDLYDYDGTPYPIVQVGGTIPASGLGIDNARGFFYYTRQVSDELQLQGKALNDRLTYVLGFYYLNQRDSPNSFVFFDFLVTPPANIQYHARATDRSLAGFAQATYKLTDRLNLTGGFRYSGDKQSIRQLSGSLFTGAGPQYSSASKPSWTASLDYQVAHGLLAYATTRGSWRTGGFNYSVGPSQGNQFFPETTRDVELGVKYSGSDLGVPVTINADVYEQWVDNIQRVAYVNLNGGSTTLTVNVPKAKTEGVEVDASVRPVPWLTIGGSGAYTRARYTDGSLDVLGTPNSYGPFADTPKFTGNAYFDVNHPLADDMGAIRLHMEVYAQSELFFSNTAATTTPLTGLPGYELVNGRLSWANLMHTKLTASIFVRNMLNKKYFVGGNAQGNAIGLNDADPGTPRMFGGELRMEF